MLTFVADTVKGFCPYRDFVRATFRKVMEPFRKLMHALREVCAPFREFRQPFG